MELSKEEKIAKLEEAISSDATPPRIKETMKAQLEELKKPAPAPPPPQPEKKKKAPLPKVDLPHAKYIADNNIDLSALPGKIRAKINGLKLSLGKGNIEAAKKQSEAIIPLIKDHFAPPPPPPKPPRERDEEELLATVERYRKTRAKRRPAPSDDDDSE